MTLAFAEKTVLVTGGGGAIGAATAVRFARGGARVVLADRDLPSAERVAVRLRASGAEAVAVRCDVGDPDGADAAVGAARDAYGSIDIVFNNAGVAGAPAPVHELDVAAWDEVIRINQRGIFLVLRAALRDMISRGTRGSIVNMSSTMAAWDVLEGGAAYGASKAAVLALTRVSALEAGRYGIRVNAVCPGVIETSLGVPGLDDEPTRASARFAARIPTGRIGQPDDVAAVVCFLASDDAAHVSGAGWLIDGGQTLQSWSNAPDADTYPIYLKEQKEQ